MFQRRRILFVSSRRDIAGGEVYLLGIMRHLDRDRFEPIVVLPGTGKFHDALRQISVLTEVVEGNYDGIGSAEPWYRLMHGARARVNRFIDIIRKYDVALVHTNSNKIIDGALAARIIGIPHIYVAHIEFQRNLPIFERVPLQPASFAHLMGELSNKIIAVSEYVAKMLSSAGGSDKIHVLHNGIDFNTYDEALARANGALRHELKLPEDVPLVSGVGRVHPDKGFDTFVETAAHVLVQRPDCHFAITGQNDDAEFAAKLRRRTGELGIDGNIHWLGFRQDVPQILAESDIFVLSSRMEGGPYVLLEAMACECATVATRCGGIVDVAIENGKTGFLVDVGDAESMARAVIELLNDSAQRSRIGVEARRRVRERFDAYAGVVALMNLYDEVLASPMCMSSPVGVELFLHAAHEIGMLGLKLTDLEYRLRQVENLASAVRYSPLYRAVRQAKHWLGSFAGDN